MPGPPSGLPGDWRDLLNDALPGLGVIALLWFTNMAFSGWVAGLKGRDSGLWTIVALFIGPVALIAVLLLPKGAPKLD